MNKIKYYKNERFEYNLDDFDSDYRLYKENYIKSKENGEYIDIMGKVYSQDHYKEKLISRIKDFKKCLNNEIKTIMNDNEYE